MSDERCFKSIATTDHDSYVVCPLCEDGADFLCHIEAVEVVQGKWRSVIESGNDRVEEVQDNPARGSAAVIQFFCESGHRFSHIAQFHKGRVYHSVVVHESLPPGEKSPELWRD